MGCCESRSAQGGSKIPKSLPKEKEQANTAPSSALSEANSPMQDFSKPRKMKSVSFKDEIEIDVGAIPFAIKSFAEVDDNEVLERLNFAD